MKHIQYVSLITLRVPLKLSLLHSEGVSYCVCLPRSADSAVEALALYSVSHGCSVMFGPFWKLISTFFFVTKYNTIALFFLCVFTGITNSGIFFCIFNKT